MTTKYDVILDSNYDIQIASNGDILTEDFFDTAILMSIFCERRAEPSEVPQSERRRGWIGNESTPGFEIGSKLWLYEQARAKRSVLLGIESAFEDGLQWMIDDKILKSLKIKATLTDGDIIVEATLEHYSSRVDKRYYNLWSNSGVT